ncbi:MULTISPECIES: mannonate dehydratase [unclassified Ruegeria]|uniref:mannonate dehydratase n=1 Tax=unclassified Ruegeria TaxID=2625375 RepID=UPI0014891589|nr:MULTISPECIES: mannonate dehydratase [unclassified Ruegeria]NOD64798.1 mannonate dehydratase [Ruegeria sp. HKCCD6109]
MLESWRWFGPKDPIPLAYIRQTGALGIVTDLHEVPNGQEWPDAEIAARRELIEAAGLRWVVTESIPVHEDIKTGAPDWERYADIWAENLRRLARQGIRNICYNFMPVLDWTRTDLNYALPDGSLALRFDFAAYAAFDLFVLRRDRAQDSYTAQDLAAAEDWFAGADQPMIDRLSRTVIAGLPGSEESYTLDTFRTRLAAYDDCDHATLRRQLAAFLEIVLPVAEAEGAKLSIHPDDPPMDLFGLPRIVSTQADLEAIAAISSSPASGFTLCTGSLGAHSKNDLVAIARQLGPRIHFAHLRAVKREADPRSFHEDAHLAGDLDMIGVARELLRIERVTGVEIPMRPDHGHRILHDQERDSVPGYPAIGRLRGLAELRGVMHTLDTVGI